MILAFLTNTPARIESLLDNLERTAGGIGLRVNAGMKEYMCFKQRGSISALKCGFLNLVDMFTYLVSSVSSTENDFNMQLAKAWTAIDRLSAIWKSGLTDEIERSFSKQWPCLDCYMDAPNLH